MFIRRTISLLAITMTTFGACVTHAAPILWNQLGSADEVTHSAYGPGLSFYTTPGDPGGFDIVGNPAYVPGVFGNALTIGPGSYGGALREHTVVWQNLNQYLNPDRGTIEVWYKQNADPVALAHGVYRIFDGSYGLGSGINLTSEQPLNAPKGLLYFGMDFGGTYTGVQHDISAHNGTWIHLAGVWDRDGIAGSADKIRLYLDGSMVVSTPFANWGSSVGQRADIGGGNDGAIADKFAIDNLKVYNTALTDFSHRFDEGGAIPEPSAFALLGAATLPLLGRRRRRRRRGRGRGRGERGGRQDR
jgi:hypothetical protein